MSHKKKKKQSGKKDQKEEFEVLEEEVETETPKEDSKVES